MDDAGSVMEDELLDKKSGRNIASAGLKAFLPPVMAA
jgi:hypothetical protein